MNFEPSEDQRALLDAIERVAARHRALPLTGQVRFEYSPTLEHDLEQGGYFECMATAGLGRVTAAALVIELSRLPCCAEIAASSLLLPMLDAPLPRPCAVLVDRRERPARFLAQARSVISIGPPGVFHTVLQDGDAQPIDSLYAVPMGVLLAPDSLPWQRTEVAVDEMLDLWRIAIAAEIVGNLSAALATVVEHVKDRRQFGRPLGAFQAVQHRLAQCACTIEGARWLTLEAAAGSGHAALATGFAQQVVRQVAYDLHQFMGAMGLTLEHPLHRWTYRAKRLQAELGGAERQLLAAADATWTTEEGIK